MAAAVQRLIERIFKVSTLLVNLVYRIAVFFLGFHQAARCLTIFEGIDDGIIKGEEALQITQQAGIELAGRYCIDHRR
ncbi:hypothetical protein D3C71_2129000 [compost metagenome]